MASPKKISPVPKEEATGILYSYQQRWLQDTTRFKIGMFSRQTGKTFTATLEIVLHCLEAESPLGDSQPG